MAFDPTATRSGSEYSTNPFYQGAWLCYINGIAVPVQGFSVTHGVWMVPSFTIDLIPDETLMRLGHEDLVQVALFYLDQWVDPDKPEWRLLADGEIVGWSYRQTPGGKMMSFRCVAHIRTLQQLYFFFMTNVEDVVAAQDPAIQASGFATEGLSYPYALFHKGLRLTAASAEAVNSNTSNDTVATAASGDDAIKAPFEFVYNVIRGVISKEVPDDKRSLPMMNFFARHIRTTRLHNRFVRQPLLEDASTLAARRGVFPIFEAARNEQALLAMQRHTASQLSNSGSVYGIIEQVLKLVYMELSMIPNPACVQVTLDPTEDGKIIAGISDLIPTEDIRTTRPLEIPTAAQDTETTQRDREVARLAVELGREPGAQDLLENGLAGRFNNRSGTFPVDLGDPTETLNHYRETLRRRGVRPAALLDELDPAVATQTRNIDSYDVDIARHVVRTGQLPRPAPEGGVGYSAGAIDHYRQTLRQTGMTPQSVAALETTNATTSVVAQSPTRVSQAVNEERERVINARRNAEAQAAREAEDTRQRLPYQEGVNPLAPLRLAQYAVKPQCLFSAVPACNVFYPSMEDGWTLDEDYTAQPTRIYVNDSAYTRLLRAQGANRDFMLHALTVAYPEEANAVMHHRIVGANGTANSGAHETGKDMLIWPEEYFAGPKVARMALSPWFQTLMQWQNAGASTTTATTTTVVSADTALPRPVSTPVPNTDRNPTSRRGRLPTNTDYLPGSWIPSEEIKQRADAQAPVHYDDNTLELRAGTWIPGHEQRCQLPPNRYLVQLVQDLERMFPGHIERSPYRGREGQPHAEYKRPHERALRSSLRSNRDLHLVGRAVDIFFLPRRQRGRRFAGREYGDPIAEWLMTHAVEVGVQFFSWAQAGWTGNRPAGHKHHPYGIRNGVPSVPSPGMDIDDFLHNTHIHLEINGAAASGNTAYFLAHHPGDRVVVAVPAPIRSVTRPTGDAARAATATPGVLNTVGNAIPASSVPREVVAAGLESENEFQKLFYLYAQYEHFRQRYTARMAGASTRFNPYVVAGFPSVLFDTQKTGFHVVSSVQQVTHSAHVGPMGSMNTEVQFIATRMMPEFFADVRRDSELFARRIDSAPAEMIPEIRETLQVQEQAEIYYQKLFYGCRAPANGQPAAFDVKRAVGYQTDTGDVEEIRIEETARIHAVNDHDAVPTTSANVTRRDLDTAQQALDTARVRARVTHDNHVRAREAYDRTNAGGFMGTVAPSAAQRLAMDDALAAGQLNFAAAEQVRVAERNLSELRRRAEAQPSVEDTYDPPVVTATTTTVSHNIDPNRTLSPMPGVYAKAFEEYDTAMRLASRPVCTLHEYIRFWHGGETIGALIEDRPSRPSQVQGEVNTFAYASVARRDVNTTGGPNSPPTTEAVRYPATYYRRIYRLRQGPGAPPNAAERGYTDPPFGPSSESAGLPTDYAETRTDWDAVLFAYAEKIRNIQFER